MPARRASSSMRYSRFSVTPRNLDVRRYPRRYRCNPRPDPYRSVRSCSTLPLRQCSLAGPRFAGGELGGRHGRTRTCTGGGDRVRVRRAGGRRAAAARGRSPTSSSWSGPAASAAPGGTTAIPGAPATCRPTCTPSPSRPTPTGRAPSPGRSTSAPTWSTSPTTSGCARTSASTREVKRMTWDAERLRWDIETAQRESSPPTSSSPPPGRCPTRRSPDIPGLDSFPGKVFHSARWDHDYDLRGKRVAMVGTGASAIQIVPAIQPEVERLTVFQRTPPWVMPRMDRAISGVERAAAPGAALHRAAAPRPAVGHPGAPGPGVHQAPRRAGPHRAAGQAQHGAAPSRTRPCAPS